MSIIDDFDDYGNYKGERPQAVTSVNFSDLIRENGKEWMAGYLKALEIAEVDLSNILRNNIPGSSREHTPSMVRSKLKNYWAGNKDLLHDLIPLLELLKNEPGKLEHK